jgi:hypothetical protein
MQWLLIPSNAVRRLTQTWRTGYCHYLALWLILAGYSLPGTAQHLESAGLSSSLNVTQTLARPYLVDMGSYVLDTNGDNSRYDEIGYRLAAYARWQVGASRFFAQPEVAYTSTRGQAYLVLYDLTNSQFGPAFFTFGHRINRWEVAALGGLHTGRHTYILAGPVIAFNQREAALPVRKGYPASDAIYNSLFASVLPVQLLAQAGVGVAFGRFDLSLRFEQSLTPYTRRFAFDGTTYRYEQQIRQGLFTAGILLYKRRLALVPAER